MAKTRDLNEALEKYKGSGNNDFFTLANDKETAVVRYLHDDKLRPEEDWFVVHQVEIQGKKRWVQCTEEANCPLCKSIGKPVVKLFLQLVDKRDGKTKTWERGREFVSKVTGLMNKYGPLCNRPYEIERHGKKGDQQTKYEIYPLDKDDKTLETVGVEKQVLLGENGFILQKSYEDLVEIAEGSYTPAARVENPVSQVAQRSSARSGSDIF